MIRFDDIVERFHETNPGGDISRIQRAYIYSAKQHEGQLRKSGEPYMSHPLAVAEIVAGMGLDEAAVCAALLHDTLEDTDTTREDIVTRFGEDVAALVDAMTKLGRYELKRREERQAESFRKMLIAMSADIRVLLVKLADRLHNMRTLGYMSEASRERIASETREIYAPLADRLGISWLKAELDDLSFEHLEPEAFAELSAKVNRKRKERTQFIERRIREIRELLGASGFEFEVTGREKNLYSVYKKMVAKAVEYEDVDDAIAFRVICQTVGECYAVLGLVHSRWKPVPGRFKDFIAIPKANLYQSLHTTVTGAKGERVEIQIRTEEMHRVSEMGIASHWAYKEGKEDAPAAAGFAWLRELVENQAGVRDSGEFLDSVKVDLFTDEVYVFTPEGDIKQLRKGATVLDFAYSVHTDVGHNCTGATVNGQHRSIRHVLANGEKVQIVTAKTQRPSTAWLDIAVTSRARNKIRSFLRAEQRQQSRQAGRELLEKGLRRLGVSYNRLLKSGEIARVASELRQGNVEDLLAQVGQGKVDADEVVARIVPREEGEAPPPQLKEGAFEKVIRKVRRKDDGIVLDGVDNLLVRFARCCSPLPGEQVIGYVSHGRGIIIHGRGCPKAEALDPERRVPVQWSPKAVSQRPVRLKVVTSDRPGILASISTVFQDHEINIGSAHCDSDGSNQALNIFSFLVKDLNQLNRVTRALKQTKGVLGVQRLHD